MTTLTAHRTTAFSPSASCRAGLALSAFVGLANLPMLSKSIDWGTDGPPPYGFLVLAAVIGMVSVVCAVLAWNSGDRRAIRLNAAALIINALMCVPGLFFDISATMKVLTAAFVLVPLVAVILTMRPQHTNSPVID